MLLYLIYATQQIIKLELSIFFYSEKVNPNNNIEAVAERIYQSIVFVTFK